MSQPTFDSFGEPIPSAAQEPPRGRASRWLTMSGNCVFWGLVIGIVLARAVYFEPGVFSFAPVVAWMQNLLHVLSGVA
jgi:hypothetical protein